MISSIEFAVVLLIVSIVWLQLAGSFFSGYIAKHPFPEKYVFLSVGIGILYTAIGGIGLHFSISEIIMRINDYPPVSWQIRVLILISPWSSFLFSGPTMAVGQYVKHVIIGLFINNSFKTERESK